MTKKESPDEDDKPSPVAICTRLLLFMTILMAVFCSMAVFASCRFLSYTRPANARNQILPMDEVLTLPAIPVKNSTVALGENSTAVIIESATIGLLQWNPNNEGCRRYENPEKGSTAFRTARASAILAALFGMTALFVLAMEFACCRFRFSRFLFTCLALFAFLCQALTFSFYVTTYCTPSKSSYGYACDYDSGSSVSIAALCFFFISMFLSCATPSARPLIAPMLEQNNKHDPCCYPCILRKARREEEEDIDIEKDEKDKETEEVKDTPAAVVPPNKGSTFVAKEQNEEAKEEEPTLDIPVVPPVPTESFHEPKYGSQTEKAPAASILREPKYDSIKKAELTASFLRESKYDSIPEEASVAGFHEPKYDSKEKEDPPGATAMLSRGSIVDGFVREGKDESSAAINKTGTAVPSGEDDTPPAEVATVAEVDNTKDNESHTTSQGRAGTMISSLKKSFPLPNKKQQGESLVDDAIKEKGDINASTVSRHDSSVKSEDSASAFFPAIEKEESPTKETKDD